MLKQMYVVSIIDGKRNIEHMSTIDTRKADKTNMLDMAVKIAINAYNGALDKTNTPYLFHSLKIMENCIDETEKICGVLYNAINDTSLSIQDLIWQGFPSDVISTLEVLTVLPKESYSEYINRITEHEIASKVIIVDLQCKMQKIEENQSSTYADRMELQKLYFGYNRISSELCYGNISRVCQFNEILRQPQYKNYA